MKPTLIFIEDAAQAAEVEALQRLVWPGDETEVLPVHILLAAAQHGGVLIGAYRQDDSNTTSTLIGFVFGFPGIYETPDGPRLMHVSQMLGVHPDHRSENVGFILKRAQWQMVRHQGIDRIIWTFDPLLSSNAHLNIAKLGAVCNTYLPNYYGVMRDGLNVGLSSDRFKLDWWVNSPRVLRRLGRRKRRQLDMAHYISAGAVIVNPTRIDVDGWVHPQRVDSLPDTEEKSVLLVEIPYNFMALKRENTTLAKTWREHTHPIFNHLFEEGYLVTDFVYLTGKSPRSFYVLSHGESTL